MKRLNKEQRKTFTECQEQLAAAIINFNECRQAFELFRDEIAGEMEMYSDERSERWHESEAGETYNEWKSAWDAELELDELEELDEGDFENSYPAEPGMV